MKKEILILGIICLFVGVGIQPAFAVEISNNRPSENIEDCNCQAIDNYDVVRLERLFNKISNTENIKLKEDPQISKEFVTGLAPETIEALSTDLAPFESNYEMKPLRGENMYGYCAANCPHGEGPCYWDVEDPTDIIQLSTQTLPNLASGGTWTSDSRWIVCEHSNGALYEIDPEDGSISDGWGGGTSLNGLAEDPTSMTLYGCDDKSLFRVDIETGDQEYIGPFGIDDAMIDIAFSSNGVCYGWDEKWSGDSYLYEIDIETGEATELFSLGYTLINVQDGDLNRTENLLYLSAYIKGSGGHLITVDPITEEVIVIDCFENNAQITGSMIIQGCWWPEHDVGVKNILSPEDGDAGEDLDVTVKVKNYGYYKEEDISVNVVILKDGTIEEYNETEIIDELNPYEKIDFEMPVWTPDDWQSVSNDYIDYKITADITLEGDEYSKNDYKEKWFELYFCYFHDVGLINFSGPETGPAQTFPVKVTIKNFGQYDECCFKTYVEISELDPEYEDFKCISNIEPGQEIELVFDDWVPDFLQYETSGTKNYTIKTWTDMDDPPDENPDNDLFTKSIILDFFHDVHIKEITSPPAGSGYIRFFAVDCSGYPGGCEFIWFDLEDPSTFNYIDTLKDGTKVTCLAIPGGCCPNVSYVPLGVESIEAIVENIGTFPETDMTCYAEIYEYVTNCSNGSLVYEDNITNIDLEDPLGGIETLSFNNYNFTEEGFYGLSLELVDDNDDYPDNNLLTLGIGCDDTPPSSIHSLDPPNPDGLNGWYISDVEVTVSATDPSIGCERDGSGIDYIAYEVNGVPGQVSGSSGTFTITTDGENVLVEYWAVDNVGNAESPHNTFTIDMDQTPPDIDCKYTWEGTSAPWLFIFTANATDATSGMERVEFYLNWGLQETVYGPGPEYIFSLYYIPPPYALWTGVAYDMAGNNAYDWFEEKSNFNVIKSSLFNKGINKENNFKTRCFHGFLNRFLNSFTERII